MTAKFFMILLSGTLLFSCNTKPESFAEKVEQAHNKSRFMSRNVIKFDLLLTFGEKKRIDGSLTLSTDSNHGILDKGNGQKIIYNGNKVYCSPELTQTNVRFDAYTWSYFFMMPYKLNDEGTQWTDYKNKELNGMEYNVEKLTFASGTGDAPDDWYVCYADKKSSLMHAAAYIVTYGKDVATAEKDPHAIVYSDYKEVYNVPFAHSWTFYGWSETVGLTDQLGDAKLGNIEFLNIDEVDFTVPDNFVEL